MNQPTSPAIPLIDLGAQHRDLAGALHRALDDALTSSNFILGEGVAAFEAALAKAVGLRHCVGVASGTDALLMAARALGLGPGDEVITTPTTWISTALAISHCGARPVFADIDPETLQMDVKAVRLAVTPRTRAVFAVHLYGHPAPVDRLAALCREFGLALVEDVAQAPQATLGGRRVGTFGDIACYSFFPGKNLGGLGDGGAVLTDRDDLAERSRCLSRYGQSRPHVHEVLGWNSRLDALQARFLLAKLPFLDSWNQRRRELAARYRETLAGLPVRCPAEAPEARSVYHLFVIETDERDRCLAFLRDRGVMVQVHYPALVPAQNCYSGLGWQPGTLPVAERICPRLFSLPIYPELTEAQQNRVVETLAAFFRR